MHPKNLKKGQELLERRKREGVYTCRYPSLTALKVAYYRPDASHACSAKSGSANSTYANPRELPESRSLTNRRSVIWPKRSNARLSRVSSTLRGIRPTKISFVGSHSRGAETESRAAGRSSAARVTLIWCPAISFLSSFSAFSTDVCETNRT